MPTGSGKTAVIGSLARCVPQFSTVVIVSPRIAVTDQLAREVCGRLFEKLGMDPSRIPKSVVRLRQPHGADLDGVDVEDAVIMLTVQQLQTWHRDGRSPLERLRSKASLHLFDEGHYEPAPAWSAAVREFSCPRVVFTATPFRNDFRLFNADPNHSFFYSFGEAVTDNVIRDIEFETIQTQRKPRHFVDRLFGLYEERIGAFAETNSRIIIRCDSRESIYDLKAAVEARGVSCIAVHERMDPGGPMRSFVGFPTRKRRTLGCGFTSTSFLKASTTCVSR